MAAIYHVTTLRKLARYKASDDFISPPVRAWRTIEAAERFSKQTGRRVILRLVLDPRWKPLEGHRDEALVCYEAVKIDNT